MTDIAEFFEGHAGTDAASAGTDATARRAQQTTGRPLKHQEDRHEQQVESNEEHHKQQLALQQMEDTRKAGGTMAPQHQTPPFPTFDSTAELVKDYLVLFEIFANANSVHNEKKAQVFLTNQTSGTSS